MKRNAGTILEKRAGGLLLPLSGLPSPYGVGTVGPEAFRFIDFLASAGLGWWQMLPVGPIGTGNSPYDSSSAFAGDPLYISLQGLVRDGLLKSSDLKGIPHLPPGRADYAQARLGREPLLRLSYQRFLSRSRPRAQAAFHSFCHRERPWLDDFCLFTALTAECPDRAWMQWEPDLRHRRPATLRRATLSCGDEIGYQKFLQYQFDRQWGALRHYAAIRNVRLLGDVAIFVAQNSADVWAHQNLFRLDARGRPSVVAGVPPDYFSQEGQRWGNPLYRWDRLAKTRYVWWIARLAQALKRFDAIRLDHFIGFHRVWEIPATSLTAKNGRFSPGPRADFFRVAQKRLGPLPFIAEDLGVVTPEVKALRDQFHFPGMKVLQFAFGTDPEARNYQPHRYVQNCVAYTGTHDNDTLVGWWNDRGTESSTRTPSGIRQEHATTIRYLGGTAREVPWRLIQLLWASVATISIVPVQDILGLGSSARMNRPGTASGNWTWRVTLRQLTPALARRLRKLSATYERLNFSRISST